MKKKNNKFENDITLLYIISVGGVIIMSALLMLISNCNGTIIGINKGDYYDFYCEIK